MKIKYLAKVAALTASLLVAVPGINACQQKNDTQIDAAKEAKEAADRAEQKAKGSDTNYDVKKTHDEHIKATEKAAGEAAKKNEKKNK